jgi:phosphoribosyl-ATP pyrophosphohydrolase/phosphoribosyl-AMP cyclohydrolase
MKINFKKGDGLVPAIIQDARTNKVLMLGYMNETSYKKTLKTGKVTFYSRSRQKLWTKGETSGNFLNLVEIRFDCDRDTLLIKVIPVGPVCHTGADTCFEEKNVPMHKFVQEKDSFLYCLEQIIKDRKKNPIENSHTSKLFKKGIKKIAQKIGEEATELALEAVDNKIDNIKQEAADLLYHILVLLAAKKIKFDEIVEVLEQRHKKQ